MKYTKQLIVLITIALGSMYTYAQDGQGLFKAKCNTCHMLGKNSTGPDLKGVKQKWEEAEEGELIYEWVKNPQALIASGKSTVAMKSKDFSPTDMTPQAVSNEEIDAILSFIDGWEPALEPTASSAGASDASNVVFVPNYEKNLTKFYFLIALLIIQIIGILILGGALKSLVKIEFLKKKSAKAILALVGMFGLIGLSNSMYAMTFVEPGASESGPWLLIEDSDLYFMVILNLLAMGVLLYMRRSFMELLRAMNPNAVFVRKSRRKKSMNKILTDVVPIEEEHTILMHHEYDGIKELDNNLPPWWVYGFYATIIFAVVYIFNYHVLGTGSLQIEEYNTSMREAKIEVDAYLNKMAMNVDESNVTLMTESNDLATGKTIYETNCVACHNPNGEGNIGPNLTDNNWIYGYDISIVFGTIKNGTPKGMPEHNSKLNPIQLQQVSSYVLSMPGAKGKEAEGEIVEE
mgnify:CR=1 FL=1